MARVFITGSSDGLGRMAAQLLIEQGHRVVLHARNERRGEEALAAVRGAETVVIGDFPFIAQTRSVAEQVNRLGSFDAVIHNAGIGYREQVMRRWADLALLRGTRSENERLGTRVQSLSWAACRVGDGTDQSTRV